MRCHRQTCTQPYAVSLQLQTTHNEQVQEMKVYHFCKQHYEEAVTMMKALHALTGIPDYHEQESEDGH